MKVKVIKVKTILGTEYAVVISKWFGLLRKIDQIYFTKDFAEIQARLLSLEIKADYIVI